MRIACVQLRAREVDDADRALEEALDAADRAAREAQLVVLPEATYPGYILHEGWILSGSAYDLAREAFGDVARRHGAWIVVGLVRPLEDGLVNSAVLFSSDGDVAAIADKRFLWHFDSRWFREGTPGEVVTLPWGPIGMFVCADARMTEIPRRLAVRGARLLLDPTALACRRSGRTRSSNTCSRLGHGRTEPSWQWRTNAGARPGSPGTRDDLRSSIPRAPA